MIFFHIDFNESLLKNNNKKEVIFDHVFDILFYIVFFSILAIDKKWVQLHSKCCRKVKINGFIVIT